MFYQEPTVAPTAEPTVVPTAEPTIEPAAPSYDFERNADGSLKLDEKGNPVAIVPEGMEIPVTYERDAEGNLILDENGNPIPKDTIPADAEYFDTIEDALDPNRTIDLYATWGEGELTDGTEATMIAVLNGYDNVEYALQWQTSEDNVNWTDVRSSRRDGEPLHRRRHAGQLSRLLARHGDGHRRPLTAAPIE